MTWTIVLAGGTGARLSQQASDRYGYARPKQYCDFDGSGTLLERTLRRASGFSPPERTIVITTRQHRHEAIEALQAHPRLVHIEQPCARDTTPGILLPLLHVLARGPADPVLLLPADHHVRDEPRFAAAVGRSIQLVTREPKTIGVVGAQPVGPADDYGWLVGRDDGCAFPGVSQFREKPDATELEGLRSSGALVNTFVLAARAYTLASVFASHAPGWWRALTQVGRDPDRLEAVYDVLPSSNFSREVLEAIPHLLRIVPLEAEAGWSDVGTPPRFATAYPTAVNAGNAAPRLRAV
jgi:mannose-1-phosphate guanylyltransferase